jgi:hypothetical protein
MPWAEGVLAQDGRLHLVRYIPCLHVDGSIGRDRLMAPK